MKARVKLGRWRQVIASIKNKRAVEVDRECLMVEEKGEVRVITEDGKVAEELNGYFRRWFQEGEDLWFQKWEGGKVGGGLRWEGARWEGTLARARAHTSRDHSEENG